MLHRTHALSYLEYENGLLIKQIRSVLKIIIGFFVSRPPD